MGEKESGVMDGPKTKPRLTRVALRKIGFQLRAVWQKLASQDASPQLAAFLYRLRTSNSETSGKEA
jgi:hypothetical protein